MKYSLQSKGRGGVGEELVKGYKVSVIQDSYYLLSLNLKQSVPHLFFFKPLDNCRKWVSCPKENPHCGFVCLLSYAVIYFVPLYSIFVYNGH